jgi:hypothetical protein
MSNRPSLQLIDNLDAPDLSPITSIKVLNDNIAGDIQYRQVTPNEAGAFGYQSSKIATFELSDSQCAWDLSKTTINGYISLAAGTTGCLDGGVYSGVQRMRLLTQNNVVLEDHQFYNVLHTGEKIITSSSANCQLRWRSWEDVLPLAEASKTTITSSVQYFEMDIELSIARIQKVLHLPVIGGLKIEITFDQDYNALSSSGSSPKLQFTNLRMNCRLIPMTQDFILECLKLAREGKFLYNYENIYVENQPWANANNSFQINFPVKSAHNILARFYLSGDVNAQNKKYLAKSQYLTGLTSIQLQHGTESIPTNQIDNPFTAHKYLQECFGMDKDTDCSSLITRANYVAADSNDVDAPQFWVALDLTTQGLNTGLDLGQSRLVFRTVNTAIPNLYCQLFMYYAVVVQFHAPGDVQVFSV